MAINWSELGTDLSRAVSGGTENLWRGAAGVAGNIANLPEWGVSEAQAAGPTGSTNVPSFSGIGGTSSGPSAQFVSPSGGVGTQAPSQPSGGGGSGTPYGDYEARGWTNRDAMDADWAATGGNPQGGSGGSSGPSQQDVQNFLNQQYDPIFANLDARLGLLPEQRTELEGEVSNLEQWQRGEATRGKEAGEAQLGGFKQEEQTKSKRTLDEFSTDIADVLRRVGGIYGGSSGAEAVGAAIGKQATRTRGQLLEARDTAISNINMKMADIGREYESQSAKIDTWKASKMTEVSTYMRELKQEIDNQMTTASSEKAAQLSNFMMTEYSNAQTYLREIDAMYKQSAEGMKNWRETREADMQDYLTRLKASSQYTGSTYQVPESTKIAGGGISTPTTGPATSGTRMGIQNDEEWWNTTFGNYATRTGTE